MNTADSYGRLAVLGAWCALMLLASPLVWTHYLVLVLPGLAVLVNRLERQWQARRRICRIAAAALSVWGIAAALLVWPAARAAGTQILGVLVVWAALIVILLLRDRQLPRDVGLRGIDGQ